MAPKNPALVATPLQLGEITGDPWADWALTGGGEMPLDVMMAMRGRSRSALRAALDRPDEIPPELAEKLRGVRGKELMFSGAPVVGFRAADGSLVMQSARGRVRLAGAPSLYDGGAGNQVAQLVLSMPFPNQGELHVGSDLAEALQAYLGGQVQPASGSLFAPSVAAGGALGAGGVMFKLRGGEG